jgi:hypothetical protein
MEKKLLRSEKDLIKFFIRELGCFDIVEEVLRIEFAFEDGTYHSNPPESIKDTDEEEEWEAQETSTEVFKTNDYSILPEKYPCVVLFAGEIDYKEMFNEAVEYVYLKDFEG